MRPLDWLVLVGCLAGIILYGLYRARGSDTTSKYLLANRTMPWYAMALSIMATQASAITFISTTGQSFVDGMRFVQMYFGLPLAMILIAAIAVPRFHSSGVYTAYEYLEKRFDSKTRALVSGIFLVSRGLALGLALYAPAVVLTVVFGWPDQWTTMIMGAVVVVYTVSGGIAAITWTDFVQMLIMTLGLVAALATAVSLLPAGVGFGKALEVAGFAGRLNPVVWSFSFSDQYNIWSGVFGGMFLALAYFGCDQSQVQRYLTGSSVTQSRLSLLFNGVAKIPMQFVILLTGAMVFAFFVYVKPPVMFHEQARRQVAASAAYQSIAAGHDAAFEARRQAAEKGDLDAFRAAQKQMDSARKQALTLAGQVRGEPDFKDTNYIFLSFVTRYMPAGIVGLVMAVILAAAMSTTSAEMNSLATVTVIDVYKRFAVKQASDRHYLAASRLATAFWGVYAVTTAQYAKNLGSLVEAVNRLGSLFYGGLLGVFTLAFFFPRVTGTAAFWAVLAGEAAIFSARYLTSISFLWYNVIGAVVVVAAGVILAALLPAPAHKH